MGSINKKFYATESVLVNRSSKTVTAQPTTLTYDGDKVYTVLKFNMTEIKSYLAQAPSYAKFILNLCPKYSSKSPDVGCVYSEWSESTMSFENATGVGTIIYRKQINPSYQKNVYFGITLELNDVINGTGLTLFNMYMDTSAPSGGFYPVNSEYTPYITIEWADKNNYYLKARRVDSKTVVWDSSAKEFFTNVMPRLETCYSNGSYIYWDASMGYGGSVGYEYIKYRNSNGNIVTLNGLPSVTCYNHTHQESIGLATLPSGYRIYDLLAQNRSNPYVEVKISSGQTIRESETAYNEQLGNGKSGTNDIIGVVYKRPVINGATLTRQHESKQYNLNVNPNYFNKYEVTITQVNYDGNGNDKISYTYTSTTKDSAIKYSYLQEGVNKLDVVVWNGDESVTYSKTFTHYISTVSNLVVTNTNSLIDDTTTMTWDSTNQGKADIVANGVIIGSVTTTKTYIIPKGKLKVGSNTIQVVVYNVADSGVVNSQISATASKNITLSRITPTASNIALSGSNTDNDLILTWESTNQSSYSIVANESVIKRGGSEKSVVFKGGSLKTSYKALKVIIYYNSGFDTIEVSSELAVSLTENTPIIYNLEPSDLNKNIDETVVATFETNEFCNRWELKANDNYTSIGTTERKVVYGSGSFSKGANTLTLTIYYSPVWSNGSVVRTCSKTVTFNGYGAPNAPVLSISEVYSTATPTISWEANEEQVAYEYILLKGLEQVKSESISSAVNSLTLGDLEDKTEYTIKVRIKNKYELYSRYSEATFSTLFNTILLPHFYIIEGTNSVQITINGYQESTFKSISIYRKDGFNDWLEIADNCNVEDSVTDYTLPCNTEIKYKLRVFNTEGAYKDTEEKTIKISLMNYWLTNIEDLTQSYKMDFVQSSYGFNRNIVYKQYTNQAAPRVFKGKNLYNTVNVVVTLSNEEAFTFINFIEGANAYNVFCYRTWKGEKLFVSVVLEGMTPINSQVMEVSLALTEINFHETKMYTGSGYRKLVYLNGEYFLDGSIDFSGYDDSIIKVVK